SLAIRRGAVAEYDREGGQLKPVAARGLGQSQNLALPLDHNHARELASLGSALSLDDAIREAQRLLEDNQNLFASVEIDLLVPLVVRDRLIGVVLLGEKASGEKFTQEDLEVIVALSRH